MTLEETARILCEPDTHYSDFERAILLFGLQVAILSPKQPRVESYARIHAAMRILEYIENVGGCLEHASLTARLALPEYKKILDQTLAREGSWRNIARGWTRGQLAKDIDTRWDEAGDTAGVIDFSYRFAHGKINNKHKAGVTMGRYFVRKIRKISDGTIRMRWREYGETAVLQYSFKKTGLRPAKLNKEQFVENLLSQVTDVDRLRRLFAAYRDVSMVLRPRGYSCDRIAIKCLSKTLSTLKPKEFSADELTVINKYPDLIS